MKKPIIGLTPSHQTEDDSLLMKPTYMRALRAAGALPLILPLECSKEDLIQLADLCDGFLFTGGPDVHPFLFGEETLPHCKNVSPARDQMEMELLPLVMELHKPVLGICRGVQLLNIALGGTIWQDIPSQVPTAVSLAHMQPFAANIPSHTAAVTPDTLLHRITQCSRLNVNSLHHQAIKDLAPGLTVCAVSKDQIIEAVEMPDYPYFLGVQWHPEYLWEKDEAFARLFQSFVQSC